MSTADETARAAAEVMFAADRASQHLGMTVSAVRPGGATVTMGVTEDMVNGLDVCHGGFVFALADSAMAFASNSHNDVSFAFTAGITWLRPALLNDVLTATAEESVKVGRNGVYDVIVTNQSGETVALFRGNTRSTGEPLLVDQPGR